MPDHLYAVLADIHGNYEALKQVQADAEQQGELLGLKPEYICLGDLVDYGPQPNDCVEWALRERPLVMLRGNHDLEAARGDWSKPSVDERWWPITIWTRFELKRKLRAGLHALPVLKPGSNSLGPFLCFHGYPDEALRDNRIDHAGAAGGALDLLERHGRHHGLFGHTHHQILYERKPGESGNPVQILGCSDEGRKSRHFWLVNEWHEFPRRRVLLNPGTVGQPRVHSQEPMGDNRAGYALLHSDGAAVHAFQWRRVEYAVDKTCDLLAGLTWLDAPRAHPGENGGDILRGERRPLPPAHEPFYDEFADEEKEKVRAEFGPLRKRLSQILRQGK
jgi:predicted phosphodiesterase